MSFERVEAALPEPLIGSDPADQLGEPGGAELVDPPLRLGPRLDQARLAQDPQVPRGVKSNFNPRESPLTRRSPYRRLKPLRR